jgi:hypothetical protein
VNRRCETSKGACPVTGIRAALTAGLASLAMAGGILGSQPASGIAGGEPVQAGSHAFLIRLDSDGARACTGSLIAPRWVVTASGCFAEEAGQAITAGPPRRRTTATATGGPGPGPVVEVAHLFPLPDRDLALARLRTPLAGVATVPLGTASPAAGEALRLGGYGRTATEWIPERPHTATFVVGGVTATTFTATGQSGNPSSTCKGDSGGPALRQTPERVELVGVHSTSWQRGCVGETETRDGVTETRTDDVVDWLRQTMSSPTGLRGMTNLAGARLGGDAPAVAVSGNEYRGRPRHARGDR